MANKYQPKLYSTGDAKASGSFDPIQSQPITEPLSATKPVQQVDEFGMRFLQQLRDQGRPIDQKTVDFFSKPMSTTFEPREPSDFHTTVPEKSINVDRRLVPQGKQDPYGVTKVLDTNTPKETSPSWRSKLDAKNWFGFKNNSTQPQQAPANAVDVGYSGPDESTKLDKSKPQPVKLANKEVGNKPWVESFNPPDTTKPTQDVTLPPGVVPRTSKPYIAEKLATKPMDMASRASSKVIDNTGAVASQVVDKSGQVLDRTTDLTSRGVDKAISNVDKVVTKTTDVSDRIVNKTLDTATKPIDGAVATAIKPVDMAANVATKGIDQAGNVISKTSGVAEKATSKVMDATGNVVSKASDVAGNVAGRTIDTTGAIADRAVSTVATPVTKATDVAMNTTNKVTDKALYTTEKFANKTADVTNTVVDKGMNVVGKTADTAGNVVDKTTNTVGNVAGRTIDTGTNVVAKAADTATDTGFKVVNKAVDVAAKPVDVAVKTTGKAMDVGSNVVGKTMDTTGNVLGKGIDTAGNVAGRSADVAGNVIGKTADTTGRVLTKATDAGANVVNKTTDTAANVANKGVDTAFNVTNKTIDAASKPVAKAAETTGKIVGKTADVAGNVLGKTVDTTGKVIGGAADVTANVAGKTMETTGNVLGKGIETTGNVVSKATDAAGNVVGKGLDVAGNVTGKAAETTAKVVNKGVDTTTNVANKGVDSIFGFINKAVDSGAGVTNKAINSTLPKATMAVNKATDATFNVANKGVDVAFKAVDKTTPIINKALDTTANVAGKGMDVAGNVVGKTLDTTGNVVAKTSGMVGNVAGKTTDVAANVVNKGVDTAVRPVNAAVNVAGNVANKATDVAMKPVDGAIATAIKPVAAAGNIATKGIDTTGGIAAKTIDVAGRGLVGSQPTVQPPVTQVAQQALQPNNLVSQPTNLLGSLLGNKTTAGVANKSTDVLGAFKQGAVQSIAKNMLGQKPNLPQPQNRSFAQPAYQQDRYEGADGVPNLLPPPQRSNAEQAYNEKYAYQYDGSAERLGRKPYEGAQSNSKQQKQQPDPLRDLAKNFLGKTIDNIGGKSKSSGLSSSLNKALSPDKMMNKIPGLGKSSTALGGMGGMAGSLASGFMSNAVNQSVQGTVNPAPGEAINPLKGVQSSLNSLQGLSSMMSGGADGSPGALTSAFDSSKTPIMQKLGFSPAKIANKIIDKKFAGKSINFKDMAVDLLQDQKNLNMPKVKDKWKTKGWTNAEEEKRRRNSTQPYVTPDGRTVFPNKPDTSNKGIFDETEYNPAFQTPEERAKYGNVAPLVPNDPNYYSDPNNQTPIDPNVKYADTGFLDKFEKDLPEWNRQARKSKYGVMPSDIKPKPVPKPTPKPKYVKPYTTTPVKPTTKVSKAAAKVMKTASAPANKAFGAAPGEEDTTVTDQAQSEATQDAATPEAPKVVMTAPTIDDIPIDYNKLTSEGIGNTDNFKRVNPTLPSGKKYYPTPTKSKATPIGKISLDPSVTAPLISESQTEFNPDGTPKKKIDFSSVFNKKQPEDETAAGSVKKDTTTKAKDVTSSSGVDVDKIVAELINMSGLLQSLIEHGDSNASRIVESMSGKKGASDVSTKNIALSSPPGSTGGGMSKQTISLMKGRV